MPNIDELSIQFRGKGIGTVVNNINKLATALESLSSKSRGIDVSKLSSLATALGELKGNIPTKGQVTRLENLATAISSLNAAAGSGSITTFANDISNVSNALNNMKGTPSKGIDKITKSLKGAGEEAKKTADQLGGVAKASRSNSSKQGDKKLNLGAVANAISDFKNMYGYIDKISLSMTKLGNKMKNLKIITPTKQLKNLDEQIEKARTKYNDLRAEMLKAAQAANFDPSSKSWERQTKNLDAARNKYNELLLKQKELALEGNAFQLNPTLKGALEAFGNGFSKVTSIVKSGFISALHKANSILGSLVKNMFRLVTASRAVKGAGTNVKDLAKKLSSELLRLSKMLKLMITRMALRKVIEEVGNGFKSLALHSAQFDKTMSDVINASKQLGYSFASMVSPLLNALAPAIISVINLLTRLINAINQVISALRGLSSWNKAKVFTDKWSDSIKEAGKSGSKAAKELKKTVLAFDELNQLQDNKNKGGGGSDIKDMFDTVEIDPKWKKFAEWLKDMWDMKDFTDLGKLWGTKLRDALERIPWTDIRKTSNDLGKCLATLINGLVEVERLGYDIGYTVAQGVNTVFEFINGFVHKLHWDSIGKFIARMFNGFFGNIDWKLIKDTVVTGMAGIAEAIQNFINTFHWDNISRFIINAIDTIVSGIKAFVEGIDWSDLGHKIGDQLTKTIQGVNWREVGGAIGEIFQAAIDFFAGIIDELNVDDVVYAASEMFQGFFDKIDTEELGRTIGKVLQFCIDFIKKFWDENKDVVKEKVSGFFRGIFEEIDKADLIRIIYVILNVALLAGVLSAVKYVLGVIASKAIGGLITKAIFGTGASGLASTLTAEAASAGTQAGTTLGDSMGAGVTASATTGGLAKALSGVVSLVGYTFGGLMVFLTSAENSKGATAAISKMLGFDDETVKKFQDTYSGFGGTFKLLQDSIKTIGGAISGNKEDMSAYHSSMEESYSRVSGKVDEHTSKVKESETATSNLIKVYKSENEVLADQQKAHDNVVGSYKTHWDVINQSKKATEDYGKSNTDLDKTLKDFNATLDEVRKALGTTKDSEKDVVNYSPEFEKSLDEVRNAMSLTGEEAEKTGTQIVEGIKEPMRTADFSEETKSLFDVVFKGLSLAFGIASPAKNMMPIGENIVLGVNEGMQDEYKSFDDTISDFYNNHVKTWFDKDKWSFSGVADGLKSTFESAKEGIGKIWNSIADNVNGEHEIGSSKIKINLPKFKYATGGFPEDGLFFANHNELVGEFSNGKTAVANNAQIVEGIQRGVYSAVSSAMANNSSGSQYISNEIIVDGEVVARSITKAQEKMNRRYSPQTV